MARSPSTENYTIGKAHVFVGEVGGEALEHVGNAPAFSWEAVVEESEHFSSMEGVRQKDDVTITQLGATIRLTLDEITAANLARATLGSRLAYTQESKSSETKEITDVEVGKAYSLGATNVTITSVTDGDDVEPVEYTAGTHYVAYPEAGVVLIKAKPEGAGDNLEITYDVAAVDETADREAVRVLTETDFRVRMLLVGTSSKGRRMKFEIPIVRFKPAGAVEFIGEEYMQIELEGEVLADANNPSAPFGVITALN